DHPAPARGVRPRPDAPAFHTDAAVHAEGTVPGERSAAARAPPRRRHSQWTGRGSGAAWEGVPGQVPGGRRAVPGRIRRAAATSIAPAGWYGRGRVTGRVPRVSDPGCASLSSRVRRGEAPGDRNPHRGPVGV